MRNKILFAIPVLIMCIANVVFGQAAGVNNSKDTGTAIENLTSTGTLVVVVLYIVFDFVVKMRSRGSTSEALGKLSTKVDAQLSNQKAMSRKIGDIEKRLFTGTDGRHSLITETALLKDEVKEMSKKIEDLDEEIKNITR